LNWKAYEKIIAACPDAEWRLIVALARYGGLRTPSEIFVLHWGDVDWERDRITIRSPKTAHHPGGGIRQIPLFPELRPYLETVFDEALEGSEYVIAKHHIVSGNLRTTFEKIIKRAGLVSWPRLFQNLRASRETELAESYPIHIVTAWIGNSETVATKHYLQVRDVDFDRAVKGAAKSDARNVQNPVQQPAASFSKDSQTISEVFENKRVMQAPANPCDTVQNYIIPPRGVEPLFSD
jgi:integrase